MNLAFFFNGIDIDFVIGEIELMDSLVQNDRYLAVGGGFDDQSYLEYVSDLLATSSGRRLAEWARKREMSEWHSRLAFIFLCRHCQDILGCPRHGGAAFCLSFKENLSIWEDAALQTATRSPIKKSMSMPLKKNARFI